jgi:hypothetical protein
MQGIDLMCSMPVVIFGAGATKACGGPLTAEILPRAFECEAELGREDFFLTLDGFLIENFHVPENHGARQADHYPALPLLISLIDTAIDRKHSFGANWPVDRLMDVRNALEYAIFALLDSELTRINNHYRTFLDKLVGLTASPPVLVSLNYDIIADNTLIWVGQNRIGEGFPDYGCDIATHLYRERGRYGSLYKLHGSLNWLHCPGCNRLDLGVTESGRSTAKVLEELYIEQQAGVGDLTHRYTCHGSSCPDCGTFVRPVMITPTHLKDYRNPHISQVWYHAERALRKADHAYIIGYSLPGDDVDVIYLLKRGLSHLPPEKITIVEHDPKQQRAVRDHPVGARYCTLFGDHVDWQTQGFAAWAKSF